MTKKQALKPYRVDPFHTRRAIHYLLAPDNQEVERAARVLARTYDITAYDGGEGSDHMVIPLEGISRPYNRRIFQRASDIYEFEDEGGGFEQESYEKEFGPLPDKDCDLSPQAHIARWLGRYGISALGLGIDDESYAWLLTGIAMGRFVYPDQSMKAQEVRELISSYLPKWKED